MTETKHTPGAWRKNYGRRHSPDECDIEIVGDIFVLANISGPNYAHCEANADLFAAAPDLFEALKAHDAYMSEAGFSGPEDSALHPKAAANWRTIRAALAKVTGE